MDKELEAEEIFYKKYPAEKRCGNSMFYEGKFKKGFIAGFLAAQKDIPSDILKATNDNFKDLLL